MYYDQGWLQLHYSVVLDLRKTILVPGLYRGFHSDSLDIPELTYLCCARKLIQSFSALEEVLWILSQLNMLPYQAYNNFRSFFLVVILSLIYNTICRQCKDLLLNHHGIFIRVSVSLTKFFLRWKLFIPFSKFCIHCFTCRGWAPGPVDARRSFAFHSKISRHHLQFSVQFVSS